MLQPATDKGNEAPVTFFGVATSVLLAAGLLCVLSRTSLFRIHADIPAYRPQYVEIYRLGEVKGISMPFMTVDLLGGVFSTLSLVFKSKFDVLAGVAYSLVVVRLKLEKFYCISDVFFQVLDGVVILLAFILNPIARRRQSRSEDMENARTEEEPAGVSS